MHLLLLAIAVALPCWYGFRRSVTGGRVEINHVTTFSFGFLFYWITPLAVRVLAPKTDFPLAALWAQWFRESFITPYALSCIALYLCFALGDSIGARRFPQGPPRVVTPVPRLVLALVTASGCALMLYSGYVMRANLFRHAEPGLVQVGVARGAVTACVILLGSVALMYSLAHPETPWRKLLMSGFFLPLLAGGVLLVALGSRLYVASLLLMFAIYQTTFRSKIKLRTLVVAGLLFAVFFGLVGTWREGSSASGAVFNVFLEPMEGSLSLVHHLRYKGIAWTNYPDLLLSHFVNLVPTLLLPNKVSILHKADAYGPLGGLHSFVSFNLNFGLLGTAVFWLLWPMMFRYFRSRMSGTLFATMYVMCSGWLAFSFFRDPFSISLVKLILEDSIIFPVLIVAFGKLVVAACTPIGEPALLLPQAQGGEA
jgi:hypothetical protein